MSSSDDVPMSAETPRAGSVATPLSGAMSSVPDSQPAHGGSPFTPTPRTPRSVPSTPGRGFARPELGGRNLLRVSSPGTPDSRATGGMDASSSRGSPRRAPSESDIPHTESEYSVWGTNINLTEAMHQFGTFLTDFRLASEDGDDDMDGHYVTKLKEIAETEVYNLNIDCQHLYEFPETRQLYKQLVQYPAEMIPVMDMVVLNTFSTLFEEDYKKMNGARIQVRLFNLQETRKMRDLNPSDIDQLVSIRGMVTRVSGVVPEMRQAYFRCRTEGCFGRKTVDVDRGYIAEPASCDVCQDVHCMQVVHNLSVFDDRQTVKMQETPESIPEGETPHTVTLVCHSELVDVARPGDRVEITGVFRAVPQRVSTRRRVTRAVYQTYLDVLHIRKSDKRRVSAEDATAEEGSEFSMPFEDTADIADQEALAAKRARFERMAEDPAIYDKLAASLAPSIWEMEDVKKGLLCQLFGGTNKNLGKQGNFRGEINVLLCGDPGTSKSQLLSYVNKISPRGIYTSGKGSSAVGLTAYITKDPDTKEMVLESGALVLSDRGICCIDEFDKMNDSTRSILHEVMEQQTVSIAKAGIICTLNARTAVLASANPVDSRYNPRKSVVENIQLPPTLLSRFDLIYLVLDKPDPDTDRRLAKHIVALYSGSSRASRAPYDLSMVTEYISFARAHVNPAISDEAATRLVAGYKDMRALGRNAGGTGKKIITATPRQLESLIRLSEAQARLRLREEVTVEDVDEAIRLMNKATQTAATDPRTGAIDMGLITTGRSAAETGSADDLVEALRELFSGRSSTVRNLLSLLQKETDVGVSRDDVVIALTKMQDDGMVRLDGNRVTRVGAW